MKKFTVAFIFIAIFPVQSLFSQVINSKQIDSLTELVLKTQDHAESG
jgi:hypothetical protein